MPTDRNANDVLRLRRNAQRIANGDVTDDIKVKSTGGIEKTTTGLGVKLDGASLSLSAAGLKIGALTTKGDVLVFSTVPIRLAVGSDGQALLADSTAATGLKWGSVVTSVGLSLPAMFTVSGTPVTTTGTLTATLATQIANLIFAGPGTGAASSPTFRSLVAADIPTLTSAKISDFTTSAAAAAPVQSVAGRTGAVVITTSDVAEGSHLYYTTARVNVDAPNVTLGTSTSGLSLAGQALSLALVTTLADGAMSHADKSKLDGIATGATANTGTVTSIALTAPGFLTVTGTPVTTSGTLALALATQSANLIFAGPTTGAAASPTFRSLVAADIPNLDAAKVTTGTMATARLGSGTADATTFLRGDQTYARPGNAILSVATAASTQLANFTGPTAFDLTATVPANSLSAGRVLRVTAKWQYANTGTPTLILTARLAGVAVASLSVSLTDTAAKRAMMQFVITIRTAGATGTTSSTGFAAAETASLVSSFLSLGQTSATATGAIDTTASNVLDFTAQWSAASASNTILIRDLVVEVLN